MNENKVVHSYAKNFGKNAPAVRKGRRPPANCIHNIKRLQIRGDEEALGKNSGSIRGKGTQGSQNVKNNLTSQSNLMNYARI
jgi:hypothetical protein